MQLTLRAFFVLPLILTSAQEAETIRETFADGSTVERQVIHDAQGMEILHGTWLQTWPNGNVREKGEYEHGKRTNRWRFYYEDKNKWMMGKYAADRRDGKWTFYHPNEKKRTEGEYARGLRIGSWSAWNDRGKRDPEWTGKYAAHRVAHSDGTPFYEGSTFRGRLQGTWTYWWPDGAPLLEAEYELGERTGEWRFRHLDGSTDPDLLTGLYVSGVRTGPLAEPVDGTPTRADPWPDVPYRTGREQESSELLGRLETYTFDGGEIVWDGMRAAGESIVPVAINACLRLDLDDPAHAAVAGELVFQLCRPFTNGSSYEKPERSPEGQAVPGPVTRLTVMRWAALWMLTGENRVFWSLDARVPHEEPYAARVLFDPVLPGERHDRPPIRDFFALRRKHPENRQVDAALAWLIAHREPDGLWRSQTFSERCGLIGKGTCDGAGGQVYDVGASGLALLAFLAEGNTLTQGRHSDVVLEGIRSLLSRSKAGRQPFRSLPYTYEFIYEHAVVTQVLAEALVFDESPALRRNLERSVEILEAARAPFAAWRYEIPSNGQNDTSVTAWVVAALVAAERVGVVASDDWRPHVLDLLEEFTEPASGRIGYDAPRTLSARTPVNEDWPREMGEAMTAAGWVAKLLLGMRADEYPILTKHEALVRTKPPVWEPENFGCDMYYWFWGTLGMRWSGGKSDEIWRKAFLDAAASQRTDGDAAGSWDPAGPWGYTGGRIYATAIMSLSLQAPWRFGELFD